MTAHRSAYMTIGRLAVSLTFASTIFTAAASTTALAATPTATTAASASVAVPSIDVELWPEGDQGQATIIAVAHLADSAKLPAKVRIPLPAGAQVTWAGEIQGADASSDIPQTPSTGTGVGGQYVELTASKSHIVQYEAAVGPTTTQGNAHTTKLTWPQTTEASQVRFAVRLPIAATNVVIKPAPEGDPSKNEQLAQMLYALPAVNLTPGSTYVVTVGYDLAPGAATGGGSATTGGGSAPNAPASTTPTWVFAIIIVAVALVPIVFLVMRRRQAATAEGADEPDAEPDAEDADPDEERTTDDDATGGDDSR